MYYINENGDIARVLGVDDRTGLATVVINDKTKEVVWVEFLREYTVKK